MRKFNGLHRPSKREQGITITRQVTDPTPTAAELDQALKEALAQKTPYAPTVRDQRARAFYGVATSPEALSEAIAEAKRISKLYKQTGS